MGCNMAAGGFSFVCLAVLTACAFCAAVTNAGLASILLPTTASIRKNSPQLPNGCGCEEFAFV